MRLRVWGVTDRDVALARSEAQVYCAREGWSVTDIGPTTGPRPPFSRRDPAAVAQQNRRGRAWAAYPVGNWPEEVEGDG